MNITPEKRTEMLHRVIKSAPTDHLYNAFDSFGDSSDPQAEIYNKAVQVEIWARRATILEE